MFPLFLLICFILAPRREVSQNHQKIIFQIIVEIIISSTCPLAFHIFNHFEAFSFNERENPKNDGLYDDSNGDFFDVFLIICLVTFLEKIEGNHQKNHRLNHQKILAFGIFPWFSLKMLQND